MNLSQIARILYSYPSTAANRKFMETYKEPGSQDAMCEYTEKLEAQIQYYHDEPLELLELLAQSGGFWRNGFITAWKVKDDAELGYWIRQGMETKAKVQAEADLS